ncbi:uncharacterized protein SCHCODRAFT_02613836 [Schizophyllum commune H4-8]|uniref:uncharacterized protein n=1 Tax=Schizophyllum commune (strain H4-8 / FGSC 9210) TaxID=578458 RepID=UPI0021601DCA|nr:uncharacterized protein SCHCODRAFT_02613836 [Schizophyllum commune H4-8]KAI5896049.1 hypothetical protein SCHCODRAFT_02613836 [Schizophyllum commune H4-8]
MTTAPTWEAVLNSRTFVSTVITGILGCSRRPPLLLSIHPTVWYRSLWWLRAVTL